MKPPFLIFVVIVAAFIAYQTMPGLKEKADRFVNKHGGWTEEAIQANPAGFIEHAQTKLKQNITTFEESRTALSASKRSADEKLKDFQSQLTNADNFATALKEQYKTAKAAETFPITVAGKSYQEADVIKQVEELLATKANAQKRIEDYQGILATIDEKRTQLTDRISQSKVKLEDLVVQAEKVRIDKLTGDADKLLAQVNTVVQDNAKLADGDSGNPVRPR